MISNNAIHEPVSTIITNPDDRPLVRINRMTSPFHQLRIIVSFVQLVAVLGLK
jgi:hypothetical protein